MLGGTYKEVIAKLVWNRTPTFSVFVLKSVNALLPSSSPKLLSAVSLLELPKVDSQKKTQDVPCGTSVNVEQTASSLKHFLAHCLYESPSKLSFIGKEPELSLELKTRTPDGDGVSGTLTPLLIRCCAGIVVRRKYSLRFVFWGHSTARGIPSRGVSEIPSCRERRVASFVFAPNLFNLGEVG